MIWNGVALDLEMHDEVADIYWDIIKMLYDMYEQPLSKTKVHWGSNVFMAEWIICRSHYLTTHSKRGNIPQR